MTVFASVWRLAGERRWGTAADLAQSGRKPEAALYCIAHRSFFGTAGAASGLLQTETTKRVWNRRRIAMTDPRFTDPRLSDPVLPRDEAIGGMWGWIAGIAVVALIAFLVIAGHNRNPSSASNNSAPVTTGSAPRDVSPPSTTGLGSSSPQPVLPTPNRSGTQ
jgi:hypothetical protein